MSVAAQWEVRAALRAAFPGKPWLDVFSKADLLAPVFAAAEAPVTLEETGSLEGEEVADGALPPPCPSGASVDMRSDGEAEQPGSSGISSASGGGEAAASEAINFRDAVRFARAAPAAVRVSAVTLDGLDRLQAAVLEMLAQQERGNEIQSENSAASL